MAIRSPNLASLIFVISHFINNNIYYVTLSAWSANKSAYERRIEKAKGKKGKFARQVNPC